MNVKTCAILRIPQRDCEAVIAVLVQEKNQDDIYRVDSASPYHAPKFRYYTTFAEAHNYAYKRIQRMAQQFIGPVQRG